MQQQQPLEPRESMSSKPKSLEIIGAPFSKGQVSLALNDWNLLGSVTF
jgi:hypothetical protein